MPQITLSGTLAVTNNASRIRIPHFILPGNRGHHIVERVAHSMGVTAESRLARMNGEKTSAKIDVLLTPLLCSSSPQQTDQLVSELITEHAEPIIRGIIRYKLHLGFDRASQSAEADDIYQEVLLQLLTELGRLREQPEIHPISDVRGLAAVITYRSCSRWMRRSFPERHALKNRLHYLLTRQRRFALWENENRKSVAGFAEWLGQKVLSSADRLRQISEDDNLLSRIGSLKTNRMREGLSDVTGLVFEHLGGPIEFDDLVGVVASLLKIRDRVLDSTDEKEREIDLSVAAGQPDTSWQVEKRIFLQRLWEEIRELPPNQRAALLLNLKDAEGRGCIALFPATGIASLRELGEALGIDPEGFAELWSELPLDDARIAGLLQLTRQQVINARKSARERLTRRLKGFL